MNPADRLRETVSHVSQVQAMEDLLKTLVEIPSGSGDREGLSAVQAVVGQRLETLGFRVGQAPGGVLEARWPRFPHTASKGPRMLLVGHVDTVYRRDDPFQGLTAKVDAAGHRMLSGPGVVDMKGGLVVMLAAFEALVAHGLLERGSLNVLLNRDEETGSRDSAAVIQERARAFDVAFVLEPGFDLADGSTTMVVARAGLARVKVMVMGVEAHAGNNPELGLSAVATAARMVAPLDGLADSDRGLLVKVCTFEAGKSINQVAGRAILGVDVRFRDLTQWERVHDRIQEVVAGTVDRNPFTHVATRASVEVMGLKHPMPRHPDQDPYLEQLQAAAHALGLRLTPGRRNGTSDGNNTAAVGTPTLDGLGVVGVGMHVSGEEAVRASSLPERAALLALTLWRVSEA